MHYDNIKYGTFLSRPNRFIAQVELDGVTETVHVKNTGRCRELLLPGAQVILARGDKPNRKTKYDLIAVRKEGLGLVNIDSQAPNRVVAEWLAKQDYTCFKAEYAYGRSRFDFYMERGDEKFFLEVKGCTLEIDGIGYFPDAPTARGTKHLRELISAIGEGYHCMVAFVIQMEGIYEVRPNIATDPEFGKAFNDAKAAGVELLFLPCRVMPDMLYIQG